MQRVHLICNAHIDPVWQWTWEEGAAAAVSTFRAAAEFCEETDNFVFCHNEVLLYQWVKEYEPTLFTRIQNLVHQGKWHIIGGWYLQPDCNIPCGESMIRQMQLGREFFFDNFGVSPQIAVSFDAFGHSRGLVQILKKAGYTGYLFMRPDIMQLPSDNFRWIGFDGSEIVAHRINNSYNSPMGGAREKVEKWLKEHDTMPLGMIPWGVGNHGGGPSRKDIRDLNALIGERSDVEILHSTPEQYFDDLKKNTDTLPEVSTSLRPFAVGGYTSCSRIKQKHRHLEAMISTVEKMCTHAAAKQLMTYPGEELLQVEQDLCYAEFHDIIPGTIIQQVEEDVLQLMDHALEVLSRLRARAFFCLAADEPRAKPDHIPVLLYNPHPYPLEGDYICEFMMPDQNWEDNFTRPRIYDADGRELPSQVEKENSNLNLDWRKRLCFHTTLAPMQMTRYDCTLENLPGKPIPDCKCDEQSFIFCNGTLSVRISKMTGLLERYQVNGKDYLTAPAFEPVLFNDSEDPWEMKKNSFPSVAEAFRLMTPAEAAAWCGVKQQELAPVHVIESGAVRTVIEAVFCCRSSYLVMQYVLPCYGNQIEIRVRVQFAEKDKMLKLCIPTAFPENYWGESIFGTEQLTTDGSECVSQKWVATGNGKDAVSIVNDGIYGSSCNNGEIQLSLMRSPAYTGHPILDRLILPQDRFTPRIDQGERLFNFRMEGGSQSERLAKITREAAVFNEPPYALSFFPNGDERKPEVPLCEVSGKSVLLSALRRCRDGNGWAIRLFASSGNAETAEITINNNMKFDISFRPYEVKTFRFIPEEGKLTEDNILI